MKKYTFTARLETGDGGGAFVFFPYDVQAEFGTRGAVAVRATIDGVPYAGSLIKYGFPQHMLGVLKAIREQIGKGPGDAVEVVLWKDEQARVVEVPAEFAEAMNAAAVTAIYEKLSYTHRKEYCRWISEAKREETKVKRVKKAVEMLRDGVKTPG